MATEPRDQPFSARLAAGPDLGVELLPLPDESPADYLDRLKALHARVGTLIDTIETRRPALGAVRAAAPLVHPPRTLPDRRAEPVVDRRLGPDDRRLGLPDSRAVAINRRFGPRDRRRMPVERRDEDYDRRRDPNPVPWQGRLRFDGVTLMWGLQVVAWIAFAAIALIYGIGR
ncbi:MAG: hypothetical protein JWM71_2425 [Solirubrobacteraceae bacterium]|nr:hypothetical protein [Solirubrobacteraceae bacterium]